MRTITCTAPSKTFNIAGLAFAYIVAGLFFPVMNFHFTLVQKTLCFEPSGTTLFSLSLASSPHLSSVRDDGFTHVFIKSPPQPWLAQRPPTGMVRHGWTASALTSRAITNSSASFFPKITC